MNCGANGVVLEAQRPCPRSPCWRSRTGRRLQERDGLRSRRGAREPRLFDDARPHRIVPMGRPTSPHLPDEPSGGLPAAGPAGRIRAAYRCEPGCTPLRHRSEYGGKTTGRPTRGGTGRTGKTDRTCRTAERGQLGGGIFATGSRTCEERRFRRPAEVSGRSTKEDERPGTAQESFIAGPRPHYQRIIQQASVRDGQRTPVHAGSSEGCRKCKNPTLRGWQCSCRASVRRR